MSELRRVNGMPSVHGMNVRTYSPFIITDDTMKNLPLVLLTVMICCSSEASCFDDVRPLVTNVLKSVCRKAVTESLVTDIKGEPLRRLSLAICDSVNSNEAAVELRAYLKKHPGDSDAIALTLFSDILHDRWSHAIKTVNRLVKETKRPPFFYQLRALIYHLDGDDRSALIDVMHIDATDTFTFFMRAMLHQRVGMPGMALVDLSEAIAAKMEPAAQLHMERAHAFAQFNDFHAADRDFKKAIRLGYTRDHVQEIILTKISELL